jgi:hypothetical protein
MDVRIPGSGHNVVPGACRPMSQILDPYAKAMARPGGAILAGVFSSNDIRAEHARPRPRFSVIAGPVPRGEQTA